VNISGFYERCCRELWPDQGERTLSSAIREGIVSVISNPEDYPAYLWSRQQSPTICNEYGWIKFETSKFYKGYSYVLKNRNLFLRVIIRLKDGSFEFKTI
jgi:hypothetical protein